MDVRPPRVEDLRSASRGDHRRNIVTKLQYIGRSKWKFDCLRIAAMSWATPEDRSQKDQAIRLEKSLPRFTLSSSFRFYLDATYDTHRTNIDEQSFCAPHSPSHFVKHRNSVRHIEEETTTSHCGHLFLSPLFVFRQQHFYLFYNKSRFLRLVIKCVVLFDLTP